MKKHINPVYISWIVNISVAMTIVGTLFIASMDTQTFTSPLNSFFWNCMFVNITFMGDAFFAFGVVLFLLVFLNKKNLSFRLLPTVLFSLLITQAIKNIFSGSPIQFYFESGSRDVGGEYLLYRNIISSHTATAFTLSGFFFLYSKNVLFKSFLIILACCVAFSRMELMGEPIEVIILGLLPAFFSTIFVYKVVRKKRSGNSFYHRIRKERKLSGQQIVHS